MKRIITIIILVLSSYSFSQNEFIPLNISKAFQNGTRSKDGLPGKNYWQNSADYKIKIKFDPYTKIIEGSETIKYSNNSPDTLDELVIRLYQNFYRANSARNFVISEESITDGIELQKLVVNGAAHDLQNRSRSQFTSTNLIIKLDKKINPNSSVDISADWKFKIPGGFPIRMGEYDSTTFFIAYWYPQIAVYDDIDGWDKIDFNGEQEMYNDFNNFDVELELPNNYLVWATGVLQNPKDILSENVYSKFMKTKNSNEVVNIVSKDDYESNNIFSKNKEDNTWHFTAENVPDFAFGVSDHYLWDGVTLAPDVNSQRKVFISAAYNPESKDFYDVARIAKEALEYFSTDMPGVPYPYPSFTAFNGGGGMEFPMIINDASESTLAGAIGLTSHEAAHTYFPFYMGINEKKYAWMDEGMAVMLPFKFQTEVGGYDPIGRNARAYSAFAGTELDMPPIIPSIMLRSPSYRVASYSRPGLAYQFLQEFLGRDVFRSAMQEYIKRWNGKHPILNDFFNTFDDFLNMDLSWYWKPWFYERGYPDLGLTSHQLKNNLLEVEIKKVGNIPIPIKLTLLDEGTTAKEFYRTADVWRDGKENYLIKIENPPKFDKIILGDVKIPDVNRENNEIAVK